jgi:hypothetical protein
MIVSPAITIKPKKISYQTIFFPKNKGSINEAKKAPVERQAKVMETLATLMALKKVNQCKAIINPAIKNLKIICLGIFVGMRLYRMYANIKNTANNILNQTNGKASSEINLPRIAVNPQINTIK